MRDLLPPKLMLKTTLAGILCGLLMWVIPKPVMSTWAPLIVAGPLLVGVVIAWDHRRGER